MNPNFQGFDVDTEEFENHRLKVASYERLLLDSIGYDFHCSHPHIFYIKYLKLLYKNTPNIKTSMLHTGMDILDEIYSTTLCIQYPPSHLLFVTIILSSLPNLSDKLGDSFQEIFNSWSQLSESIPVQSFINDYSIQMKEMEGWLYILM